MTLHVFTPREEILTYEESWSILYRNGLLAEGSYILDTSDPVAKYRYGQVIERMWDSVIPEDFPPKFRAYLLLLGVH